MNIEQFAWMNRGTGLPPRSVSRFQSEAQVTAFAGMIECGDFVLADDLGTLYRLDALLNVSLLTRLQEPIRQLTWSATGNAGTALVGKSTVVRIDEKLKVVWTIEIPFQCSKLAMDPFGTFTLVASQDGGAIVLDDFGKQAANIKTTRPLAHAEFLTEEPIIIAAADHGLLGAYRITGAKIWEQPLWSNVRDLSMTQDRLNIYLAALNHGIQVYDGQGESSSAYIVEGTVNRIAASYHGQQIFASTVENQIYRLDHDGEMLWGAKTESAITHLFVPPLEKKGVAVFEDKQVLLMQW